MNDFDSWFAQLTGSAAAPHAWQRSLASAQVSRSQLIRIPTGMGKTLGVLAAWSWHRLHRADDSWPRRLVWCLPMRVLAEQTEAVVRAALDSCGLLWSGSGSHVGKVGVHLSRSLNRGYASGRARGPDIKEVAALLRLAEKTVYAMANAVRSPRGRGDEGDRDADD